MTRIESEKPFDHEVFREANRTLNIREFEDGAVTLRSLPQVLFVELTENCNLSCDMCRSAGPYDRSKNMSAELFAKVAETLFPTARIVDLRGWGESTILKRFPDFVERTLEYGCQVRLVTNLTVPNESLWRDLVRNGALIAVSFDAATAQTFAAVRRGARLPVVLKNLRAMVDEGQRSGVGVANIHLNVVVQAPAIEELSEIVELAADLGLTRVHLNPVSLPSGSPNHLSHHLPALAQAVREAAEVGALRGVTIRLGASLDESWAETGHAAKRCTHPWMYCYVNHRGQVGFCDHLIGAPAGRYLLGDLTTSTFGDIWNGDAYRRLRASHVHWEQGLGSEFEECNWCYRNRYVDFDELSYPPYAEHRVELRPSNTPDPSQQPCSGRKLLPLRLCTPERSG